MTLSLSLSQGAVESLSIGEIKLSLRKSLLKLGFSFISGDPKLQLLICDLELVLRTPERSVKKSKPRKSPSAGRGKWMLLTNIARFLSISVTELVLKVYFFLQCITLLNYIEFELFITYATLIDQIASHTTWSWLSTRYLICQL